MLCSSLQIQTPHCESSRYAATSKLKSSNGEQSSFTQCTPPALGNPVVMPQWSATGQEAVRCLQGTSLDRSGPVPLHKCSQKSWGESFAQWSSGQTPHAALSMQAGSMTVSNTLDVLFPNPRVTSPCRCQTPKWCSTGFRLVTWGCLEVGCEEERSKRTKRPLY